METQLVLKKQSLRNSMLPFQRKYMVLLVNNLWSACVCVCVWAGSDLV